jgi:hypothetical protein
MGTKASGMTGHIRGWDVGVEVDVYWNKDTGEDECHVLLTSGSNGGNRRHLGTFTAADLNKTPTPSVTSDDVARRINGTTHVRSLSENHATMDKDALVECLANLFEKKDPQFDRVRFLAACGID